MLWHLKIIGSLLVGLSLLHLVFPRYFKWKTELIALSDINRQMMQVHTFFIGLMVFLMGILCLVSPIELTTTSLGKRISLGLGIFWIIRLLVQFFGYSPSLWLGKTFETIIHILLSLVWTYFSVVFILIFLN